MPGPVWTLSSNKLAYVTLPLSTLALCAWTAGGPVAASPSPSSGERDTGADRASVSSPVRHDHDDDDDDARERAECWGGDPRIKHVFVITLENKNYDDTFGTSTQDPYLKETLRPMGALLSSLRLSIVSASAASVDGARTPGNPSMPADLPLSSRV